MAPLIPYIEVPEIPLSFLTKIPGLDGVFNPAHPPSIKPFGTLVALGVYIGSVVCMRHGRQRGIPEKRLSEFIFWVVGIGFIGGHVLDAIFYHPRQVLRDPLYLFMLWEGLSSYGGFIGAVTGIFLWRWRRQQPVLVMCEMISSAFPLAWVFGRAGCATVHDHPGMLSDAWYAVRWKLPHGGVVGRLDLGLIEMVLTIPLAVGFLWAWHKKPVRPVGFYTGWMCIAYAPVRFLLDFLRVGEGEPSVGSAGDPRYGGLTPAQWACFAFLALGIFLVLRAEKIAASGGDGTDQGEPESAETHDDQAEGEREAPRDEAKESAR